MRWPSEGPETVSRNHPLSVMRSFRFHDRPRSSIKESIEWVCTAPRNEIGACRMAEEHEHLVDAALALDSAVNQKDVASLASGDVPEDATDVPVERSVSAAK